MIAYGDLGKNRRINIIESSYCIALKEVSISTEGSVHKELTDDTQSVHDTPSLSQNLL